MTKVNNGTRKAEELIYGITHNYYKGRTLYDCYRTCSSTKAKAWEDIKRQCEELDGENLHITGASSHQFSCIYAYPITNENGVITDMVIRKETSCNTYELTLPIEEYRAL